MARVKSSNVCLVLALVPMAAALVTPRRSAQASPKVMMHTSGECGSKVHMKVHSSLMQVGDKDRIPGAGVGTVVPFQTVFKDGYFLVDCIKDYLFLHGDLHHNNKDRYELRDVTNVSVVHYSAMIAKEDREQITPQICFNFCRTVPDMGYFGITNGRECYCEPYYQQMASDSTNCDAVCEGDNTQMCGGKTKSSIWAMHQCSDTATDLNKIVALSTGVSKPLVANASKMIDIANAGQDASVQAQQVFGQIGDPVASDLLQQAKVRAGELLHLGQEAKALGDKMVTDEKAAGGMGKTDFTVPKNVKQAEAIIAAMAANADKGHDELKVLLEELEFYVAPEVPKAKELYYPVMYFVDKAHDAEPSTCGGDLATKPLFLGLGECATICNKLVHTCIGFSHFGSVPACFLFSKVTSALHYSGCSTAPTYNVTCQVKLSEFEGTSLAPDGSGKSKHALKTVTNAARCYA